MKTTLELPEDLMRAVKLRAVRENRKLKDAVAELIRCGLSQKAARPGKLRRRVKLPIVHCARRARRTEEMTPERVARALLLEETEVPRGSLR
jgi:hypothetical protein